MTPNQNQILFKISKKDLLKTAKLTSRDREEYYFYLKLKQKFASFKDKHYKDFFITP